MSLPLTLSVVSHGHGPLLCRLLTQLNAQPTLTGVHVVVTLNLAGEVFDPSPFASLRFTVLQNALPQGFGANHNMAFRSCSTPYFAILNPDLALCGEEPFTRMIGHLQAHEACAIVAPVVRNSDGGKEDAVRTNLTPWSLIVRQVFQRRAATALPNSTSPGSRFFWVAGMCVLVDAAAFQQIGGFDQRYFLYCEDYDLCARMHLAGRSIAVEPLASIIHEARRDSHGSRRHLRWHLGSLLKVWTSAAFWRVTLNM